METASSIASKMLVAVCMSEVTATDVTVVYSEIVVGLGSTAARLQAEVIKLASYEARAMGVDVSLVWLEIAPAGIPSFRRNMLGSALGRIETTSVAVAV